MIPTGAQQCLGLLATLSICGCAPSGVKGGSSSATINLAKASEIKAIECEAAFAVGADEISEDEDRASWTWLKGRDGTLSHFCRQQDGGVVSAWDEASLNQAATHSLTFESHKSTSRFAPLDR